MEDYYDESMLIEPEQEWQTVSYSKKNNKKKYGKSNQPEEEDENSVFKSIEQHAEERPKRIIESQKIYEGAVSGGESSIVIDDGENGDAAGESGGGVVEEKKSKPKKAKKPKVTVAEAAAKIDNSDLAVFLVDISVSYEFSEI